MEVLKKPKGSDSNPESQECTDIDEEVPDPVLNAVTQAANSVYAHATEGSEKLREIAVFAIK